MAVLSEMDDKNRVVFCTYSSVYSSLVLKRLIKDERIDVVAIINSTRIIRPDYGLIKGSLKQIKMTGWRYSVYLFLVTDLFLWFQTIAGFKKNTLKSVHHIAQAYQIPVLDTPDINQEEPISFIQKYNADYLIAAHFNQLVKNDVLMLPKQGCLNIHPSLLPQYKGVDPVFYALLNDEACLGVSLHRMAKTFDSGEVLLQKKQRFNASDSVFMINCQLFSDGAELLCRWFETLDRIQIKEKILPENEKNVLDHYDSWPSSKTVSQFKRTGKYLIRLTEYFQKISSIIK